MSEITSIQYKSTQTKDEIGFINEISKGIIENMPLEYLFTLMHDKIISDKTLSSFLKKTINSKASNIDKMRIIEFIIKYIKSYFSKFEDKTSLTETLKDGSCLFLKLIHIGEYKILELLHKSMRINFFVLTSCYLFIFMSNYALIYFVDSFTMRLIFLSVLNVNNSLLIK